MNLKKLVMNYYHNVDTEPSSVHGLFHEHAIYERPGYETLRGRGAISHFYAAHRIIATGKHKIDRILVEGPTVIALGSFRGEAKTRVKLQTEFSDLFMFEENLIHYRKTYFFVPSV